MDENPNVVKEPKQAFLAAYGRYMKALVANSKNEFILFTNKGDGPEQRMMFYNGTLLQDMNKSLKIGNFDYFIGINSIEEAKELSTEEGMNKFLHKVDEALQTSVNTDQQLTLLQKQVKEVEKKAERLEVNAQIEAKFQEANGVISDKQYDLDDMKDYMNGMGQVFFQFKGNKIRVPKPEEYADSRDKGTQWLKQVGLNVSKHVNATQDRRALIDAIGDSPSKEKERMENIRDQANLLKVIEKANAVPPDEYMALDAIRVRGAIVRRRDGDTTDKEDKKILETQARKLLKEIATKRPNKEYTPMDQKAMSMAMELIAMSNPKDLSKLQEEYSMKKGPDGYELAGLLGFFQGTVDGNQSFFKMVKDADPMLMKSSDEFKAYKKEVLGAEKQVAQFKKDWKSGKPVSEEQLREMLFSATRIERSGQIYTNYKLDALGDKAPNATELKRLKAAAAGSSYAEDIRRAVHEYTMENAKKMDTDTLLNTIGNRATFCGSMSEVVYFNLINSQYKKDKNAEKLMEALSFDNIQKGKKQIEADPAFQKAANSFSNETFSYERQQQIYDKYMKVKEGMQQQQEQVEANAQKLQQQAQKQNQQPQMGGPGGH